MKNKVIITLASST